MQLCKKLRFIIVLSLLFSLLLPMAAMADMGPKNRIVITVENAAEDYYLDILTKDDYRLYENMGPGNYDDLPVLEPDLVSKFYSLEKDGWYPFFVQIRETERYYWGTPDLRGELQDNGTRQHRFDWIGAANIYRIQIVSDSGDIWISDIIRNDVIWGNVTVDYATKEVQKPSLLSLSFMQFAITCSGTLLLEGILLILFGLVSRRNVIVFFAANVITQIGFTLTIGLYMLTSGPLLAMLFMFVAEFIILIAETLIYRDYMDKHSLDRRTYYGIVANLFSWIIGTYFLYDLFYFLADFM